MDAIALREAISRLRAEEAEQGPAPMAEPEGSLDQSLEQATPWLSELKKAWANLIARQDDPSIHQG